jgi:predicted DNA-binding transcriptional regulator YafY
VDPWAVVVRHRRWYLLCWSLDKSARRVLRVDRIRRISATRASFERPFEPAPEGLDPLDAVEEQLSQGWRHPVEVVVEAPLAEVQHWLPRSFGRLEVLDDRVTRLVARTDEPDWYVAPLANLPFAFRILGGDELRDAAVILADRLTRAVS